MCDRRSWTEEIYGSYRLKGPREVRVLRYDTLAHDDGLMYLISVRGYVE